MNEQTALPVLLGQLQTLLPLPQIIVSDGGSSDQTLWVANQFGVEQTSSKTRGRGPQLNAGADLASGDVLLFLHADSHLPQKSYAGLCSILAADPGLSAGCFRFSLANDPTLWARVYEFNVNLRCRLLNLPYGDQGFFIRRSDWSETTRFAEFPIMEDVEWWQRIRTGLHTSILPYSLITSTRRFRQRGFLLSALRNLWLLTRFKLGASPRKLVKEYNR